MAQPFLKTSRACFSAAGFYLACKMHLVYKQMGMIFAAARVACRSEALFGKYASSDEVMEVGNSCAICQVRCAIEFDRYMICCLGAKSGPIILVHTLSALLLNFIQD